MDRVIERRSWGIAALAVVAAAALALAAVDSGAAARKCGGFPTQAAAQIHFVAEGGGPGRNAGGLDPDRDGVACEELGAPYKGYATIGYNRAKGFFYGVATMPSGPPGEEARCLEGNRHFPDGPRKLNVYRVRPGADAPILADLPGAAAEANRSLGKLFWKAERRSVTPAVYYVEFEDRIREDPYKPTECPGFASEPRRLPKPQPAPRR